MARILLLLLLAIGFICAQNVSRDIPYLKVTGTHYGYSFQVGQTFKDRIQSLIRKLDIRNTIMPWITANRAFFYDLVDNNSKIYPEYFREFEGLADGAEIPVLEIIILNFYDELMNWISPGSQSSESLRKVKSCSDVMISKNGKTLAMGHNEDESPNMAGVLIDVQLTDDNGTVIEQFLSYAYPGNLPGNAFTFNRKYSLFLSMNSLFPVNATVGLNQALIARSFISAKSMAELKLMLLSQQTKFKRMGGFNFNFADENEIVTAEFSPLFVNYIPIPANYTHFNRYKRLTNVLQYDYHSSKHRQARADLLPQETISDILAVLGDTGDREYPIYRNAHPPDTSATLASILCDFTAKKVSLFNANPKISKPFMAFSFDLN